MDLARSFFSEGLKEKLLSPIWPRLSGSRREAITWIKMFYCASTVHLIPGLKSQTYPEQVVVDSKDVGASYK